MDSVRKNARLIVMPKFTIKDLLVSFTLVAIGLTMVVLGFHLAPSRRETSRHPSLSPRGRRHPPQPRPGLPLGKGGMPFLLVCGIIAMLIIIFVFNSMSSLP